jgi:membrane-bound inhibitor of C-type lysozyme
MRVRSAFLALALLGGASSAHAQRYINFQCADGGKLSLIFEQGDSALLMVGGGALRLQKRKSASGLWYASPYGDLRAAGARAKFTMAGRPPTTCVKAGAAR